ncbi:hypothetical protein COY27_02740 [Candidatus Woesearchaeota archaeon CG_4_10_14_0_2_um_filter_33_13]|nr:MAG: hypothetical protein COY27_02740 [Candidatus Woesearchaeota archaeon CG_4_10_14_0_2_um_filter_33_13]
MELICSPYDFEYKVKGDKTYIYSYSKLEDNSKVCLIQQFQPYFYLDLESIDEKELEKRIEGLSLEDGKSVAKILSWKKLEKEQLGKKKKVWKIYTNYPKAVAIISKELTKWGLTCYENDIVFVQRYIRDNKILPLTAIKAEGQFVDGHLRVPVFLTKKIVLAGKEPLIKLKYLAVDIETYSKHREILPLKNPILMIGLSGLDEEEKEFQKVITWNSQENDLDYLENCADEAAMIQRFKEIVIEYSPDVITGYFSDGFDFPYIKTRADLFKIKLDLGLDYSELDTGKNTDLRDGKSKVKGILHIDIFKFVRYIFGQNLKTESYSLDSVSEELLGSKKHSVDLSQLADTWDNHRRDLKKYYQYNLQDANLTVQLCHKLMYDIVELAKIVSLPIFDLTRMRFSKLVESYILRQAVDFNVLAPNKPSHIEIDQRIKETYQGGFVLEPTPGFYENIVIFDFRSLYPTIITSHNIGPEALKCSCCPENKVPGKEEYWFCQNKKSFISTVLEHLVLLRSDLKKLIKETKAKGEDTAILSARSYALKILANSFYGYTGFFAARWYCLECARSTTAYARHYITSTIEKAKDKGFKVIYADTDSCFLLLGKKNLDEAMRFMDEVNSNLPGQMELEYEGMYKRGIFVATKGSEKGAKKKYALISEKREIKITGFESVRRNWSTLAKEIQELVLRLVLENKVEEAIALFKETAKKLKEGKIDLKKLIIKTQITRELSAYSSIGPHVAVAQRMIELGYPVVPGTLVEYIIAKGSGLIRERAKLPSEVKDGEYDAEYYLKNQLLPAVSSIFAVLGYKEEDLIGEGKQQGLGQFF